LDQEFKKGQRKTGRVTSYDVARAAGVSQSSVSRAFNPDGPIDIEMRKKIRAAARSLGWRPNSIASSLQKRQTDFIGLITAELSSPWRAQQLASLIPALEQSGHRPLMFHTSAESEIDSLLDEVLSYQGKAVVIGAGLMSSRIAKVCARQGLLVILLNRWVKAPGVVPISCDHLAGARQAVDHLAEKGCKRLCFLQGRLDSYAGQQRTLGFLERCTELGLTAEIVNVGAFERANGWQAGEILAARKPSERPHGVLASNDAIALGVLDHAYATEAYSVPRDFALVGFDDLTEAGAPAYQLTTIRQPLAELTGHVVDLLEAWKAKGKRQLPFKAQFLMPALVERRSSRWAGPAS
jgi:DNA-binding LacI/PurR family transcriptional regulator